ncbi:hypothetical protein [uncultured Winogradskyella sp.]|uniref:hypothetical protein n=1 Tax=uncultured Winogradskyella sp. TaxID=395353 RepID=UPI0026277157|nr:hypothetical protein [uncultured Winogradskyella sp.]
MKLLDFFKKPLESASDEITSKFKTPFFSTFLIVWVITNNKFIYDLFFNSTIKDKTDILSTQFNLGELSFYGRSLLLIGITLLIMLIYYIIINISRTITMISEERIKVNLLSSLKSKTIGTMDDVDFWKTRADSFKEKTRELETELSSLRLDRDNYKNKLLKADEEIDKVIKSGKSHVERTRSILSSNLYTFMVNPSKNLTENKIKDLKSKMDSEFKLYNDELKPKTPSFLIA